MKKLLMTGVAIATLAGAAFSTAQMAQAEDTMFVPSLSYRTGPFASGGASIQPLCAIASHSNKKLASPMAENK